jgi:predicted HicB family RNase H-like nuclease
VKPRPVGRPPRAKKAATRSVHLRLTEAEYRRYVWEAARAGVSVSEWARAVLDGMPYLKVKE